MVDGMASRLVHPQLMQTLQRDFFKQSCRIEQAAKSQNTTGQETKTWSAVPGWESIPCRKTPAGGGERRTQQGVYLDATHTIVLATALNGLTTAMRAVVDGKAYDILLVEPDSEGITMRLTCRIVQ